MLSFEQLLSVRNLDLLLFGDLREGDLGKSSKISGAVFESIDFVRVARVLTAGNIKSSEEILEFGLHILRFPVR